MFYVLSGNIFVKTKNFDVNAKSGETILLDCREPHIYGCNDAGEFLWFHFNGIAASPYVEHLYEKSAYIIVEIVLKSCVCAFKR